MCLAYLEHFAGASQAVVQHRRFRRILDKPASAALFELVAEPPTAFRRDLIRGVLRFGVRRNCSGKGRLYLNIGHTGLDHEGFRAWVRDTAVRPVYLVHDLIPITHPEFCRPGERDRHKDRMQTVLTTAAGVIGNSKATLEALAEFGRVAELPSPPALAAWLGSTPLPAPEPSTSSAERPSFVVLGTIEARKNHLMLLHVWTRLVRALAAQAPGCITPEGKWS